MKLTINKEELVTKLLIPAVRFSSQVVLHVVEGEVYVIAAQIEMARQQVFLLASIKADVHTETDLKLNIGDIKRFMAAVKCIDAVDVEFEINENMISYQSEKISFRFHMLEDSAMIAQRYSRAKLDSYDGSTKFQLSYDNFRLLLQTMSCMAGNDKIYLSTDSGVVYCTQTDKMIPNTDSMKSVFAYEFSGTPLTTDVILCTDVFKLLSGLKFEACEFGITSHGLVILSIRTDTCTIKYFVPSQIQ